MSTLDDFYSLPDDYAIAQVEVSHLIDDAIEHFNEGRTVSGHISFRKAARIIDSALHDHKLHLEYGDDLTNETPDIDNVNQRPGGFYD